MKFTHYPTGIKFYDQEAAYWYLKKYQQQHPGVDSYLVEKDGETLRQIKFDTRTNAIEVVVIKGERDEKACG